MKNKTIAIIPARGGSKRLPGKNLLPLGGIPLLGHSILYAQKQDCIGDVYVSTDDDAIAAVALQFGAKVIRRPEVLSGDFEPTVSALRHVLESITETVDDIILLQATNPLRPENLLKAAYQIYTSGNHESLFTVTRNHHKLGRIVADKYVPFNYIPGQRSQDLEPLYFENGLLYICKANLIEKDCIISAEAFPMIVDHPFALIDIDTAADLDYATYVYKNNFTEK